MSSASKYNKGAKPTGTQKPHSPAPMPKSSSAVQPEQALGYREVPGFCGVPREEVYDLVTKKVLSSRLRGVAQSKGVVEEHSKWKKKYLAQEEKKRQERQAWLEARRNVRQASPPASQGRKKLISGAERARGRAEKAHSSASIPPVTTPKPGEKRKVAESSSDARAFGTSGDTNQPPKRQKVDVVQKKIYKSSPPTKNLQAKPVSAASPQKKATPSRPMTTDGGKPAAQAAIPLSKRKRSESLSENCDSDNSEKSSRPTKRQMGAKRLPKQAQTSSFSNRNEDTVVALKPSSSLTKDMIVAWFASNYPDVSEISNRIIKRYMRDVPVKKEASIEESAQKVTDENFRRGESEGLKYHVTETKIKRKLEKEEWQLTYGDDDIARTPKRRKTSSSPSRARSTSGEASDRTTGTSVGSENDPVSPPSSGSGPGLGPELDLEGPFGLAFTSHVTPRSTLLLNNNFGEELVEDEMVREKIEKRMVETDEHVEKFERALEQNRKNARELPRKVPKAERPRVTQQLKVEKEAVELNIAMAKSVQKRAHRNIDNVVFGSLCFPTWYSSDYPRDTTSAKIDKELLKEPALDRMYICEKCFAYTKNAEDHVKHHRLCSDEIRGRKIYDHDGAGVWSVHEVDGEKEMLFCQNLSLFAKLFLGDKSVSYYTALFDYFCLVHTDPTTRHQQVIGFFSKEKNSYDQNNLACILVFPPWQGMSLGKMLIGVSYEISRMEQAIGGPERPFSSMGEKSYRRYWQAELARWILEHPKTDKKKGCHMVDIQRISRETCILEKDCIDTINSMNMGLLTKHDGPDAGQPIILDQEKVRKWVKDNRISLDRVVDKDGFIVNFEPKVPKVGSNHGD